MPVLGTTAPGIYTVGYLVDRTFDLLLGAQKQELNQLQAAIGAGDTEIAFTHAIQNMTQGTYLAVDNELMYVWSSNSASGSASSAVVQRGMRGTLPAAHDPGALVEIDPYFTRYQVRATLQDEIRSWGPQVYAVKTVDLQGVNFVRGYDLGSIAPWFTVLKVQRSPTTIIATPPPLSWPSVSYRVDHMAPTVNFPSGNALYITDPIPPFDTPSYHVTYAAPFNVDASFNDKDSLANMGIDSSDIDIAPYGAAWRLASSREVRRMLVEAKGTAADLQNFPPGYALKAAEEFKMLRDARLHDAITRLQAQYPIRRTA